LASLTDFLSGKNRTLQTASENGRQKKCFIDFGPTKSRPEPSGSELVRSWFDPDSVMEFGFYETTVLASFFYIY